MLIATLGVYGLIAFITLLEWVCWRKRRRRRAEIDAFMEWDSYPEPAGSPNGVPDRLAETSGVHSMSEENRSEIGKGGNGPRYDYSAAAAAEIINLHLDPSQPKEILFGRILSTILEAMNRADEEVNRSRWEPGNN